MSHPAAGWCSAFYGCTSLAEITLPPAITAIREYQACNHRDQGVYPAAEITLPTLKGIIMGACASLRLLGLGPAHAAARSHRDRPVCIRRPLVLDRSHSVPGKFRAGPGMRWLRGKAHAPLPRCAQPSPTPRLGHHDLTIYHASTRYHLQSSTTQVQCPSAVSIHPNSFSERGECNEIFEERGVCTCCTSIGVGESAPTGWGASSGVSARWLETRGIRRERIAPSTRVPPPSPPRTQHQYGEVAAARALRPCLALPGVLWCAVSRCFARLTASL